MFGFVSSVVGVMKGAVLLRNSRVWKIRHATISGRIWSANCERSTAGDRGMSQTGGIAGRKERTVWSQSQWYFDSVLEENII